jgi:hypothetical protein
MVLGFDLTVMPEELPILFRTLVERGEFVNGSRLVYPVPNAAMKVANRFGNKVLGIMFSFLLDQPIKDALCGIKIFWRKGLAAHREGCGHLGIKDLWGRSGSLGVRSRPVDTLRRLTERTRCIDQPYRSP